MKRYMLFAGWDYYPSGGMRDFVGSYDTFDEAREDALGMTGDWWHILDIETGDTHHNYEEVK